MKKNNLPKKGKNNKIQRRQDPIPWRYCFLTVICGLILVTGFFFAARQHFSAIELGIKNAKLRQQKDELENVQRQLYLAKETALSPVSIKNAAKKIGLQELASSGITVVSNKAQEVTASAKKLVDQKITQGFVAKTSFTSPSNPPVEKDSKESKEEKESKPKNRDIAADNIRPRVVSK